MDDLIPWSETGLETFVVFRVEPKSGKLVLEEVATRRAGSAEAAMIDTAQEFPTLHERLLCAFPEGAVQGRKVRLTHHATLENPS